jgi:hypothetical protein
MFIVLSTTSRRIIMKRVNIALTLITVAAASVSSLASAQTMVANGPVVNPDPGTTSVVGVVPELTIIPKVIAPNECSVALNLFKSFGSLSGWWNVEVTMNGVPTADTVNYNFTNTSSTDSSSQDIAKAAANDAAISVATREGCTYGGSPMLQRHL